MKTMSDLIALDTAQEVPGPDNTTPLRVLTCGDAGTGKSTLIASLLNTRRQITFAEVPGDHDDTRTIVAQASTADVALIVVDAAKDVLKRTQRHSYLASLLGIGRVVLAVNKLDLMRDSRESFDRIQDEYLEFGRKIGLEGIVCIPASALRGDNVITAGALTRWYRGPTLAAYLEAAKVERKAQKGPFRMLVQSVNRSDDLPLSAFAGRIVGGSVHAGDRIRVLPSAKESTIRRIWVREGDLAMASAGQLVTVSLVDGIDVNPGDMLAAADAPPELADQFEAEVVWMGEAPMLPGRLYLMKIGERIVGATITKPKYKLNVSTLEHLAATTLEANDIGVCNLHIDSMIPFDAYTQNRHTGSFVLLDRQTEETVAAGFLHFALRRSQNIHWQAVEVGKQAHAALKGQRSCVVWFTGLSGAGKSTIANVVEKKLHAMGRHTFLLDGDNVRHGLNKDLGFTEADRVENIRRVAEVAKLMVSAGLIVLVSFISPFRAERRFARDLVEKDEFCEVFVDVPLEVAEQRDRKGLYKKARRGELKNFTGIDSPYEPPESPELRIDAAGTAVEAAADHVIVRLRTMEIL